MTTALQQHDPVRKQAERGLEGDALSPMDPPDAYTPPVQDAVPPDRMHAHLRQLHDEHAAFLEELKRFEAAILAIQQSGLTRESDAALRRFFQAFDDDFLPHSRREELGVFPLLNERLLTAGDHGAGEVPITPITVMLDDHLKATQLAAVVFNFFGLACRLPDERSRLVVLDAGLEQAKNLIELLRLHIFREDTIIFSAAQRRLTEDELDAIATRVQRFSNLYT